MDNASIVLRSFGTRCCDDDELPHLGAEEAEFVSAQLQLIAHPVRLRILDILARHAGQVCVCDLESALPVKQATISHHLRLLREGGLIDCERHGQWAYYFVKRDQLAALRAQMTALFDGWG